MNAADLIIEVESLRSENEMLRERIQRLETQKIDRVFGYTLEQLQRIIDFAEERGYKP